MITRLVAFNTWHFGDMHISKEFVKKFFAVAQKKDIPCFYATDRSSHSVNIPVEVLTIDQCDPATKKCPPSFSSSDGTFYMNTWVGHYMTSHQHNVVNQIPMWKDIAIKLIADSGGGLIVDVPAEPWMFVPEIEEKLLYPFSIPSGRKVLICNNSSISLPTFQSNLYNPIHRLAEEFPDVKFICTLNMGLDKPNVFYTENIINNLVGNDLPEIGYLASKCDVVVSNSSGPGTFVINKAVLSDPKRRILSFSHTFDNTLWAGVGAKAHTSWEQDASDHNFYEKVRDALSA